MSLDPLAPPAARQALVYRIHRFVAVLERVRRSPNHREAYHVAEALQSLQDGRYEQGEDAMTRAERVAPLPAQARTERGPHEAMTAAQLRDSLNALLRAEE